MKEIKQQAAAVVAQVKAAKGAGMLKKAEEIEKAVDQSVKLMLLMLTKIEELEQCQTQH